MKIVKQSVMSEPQKILIGTYKTKSGQVKNRYKKNPNAKHLKTLWHKENVITKDEENLSETDKTEDPDKIV
jgi:hypothetical protein